MGTGLSTQSAGSGRMQLQRRVPIGPVVRALCCRSSRLASMSVKGRSYLLLSIHADNIDLLRKHSSGMARRLARAIRSANWTCLDVG